MESANSTPRLKMKDLQTQTGLSKQTIHFYLREGLLPEPEKPKSNVAYYSDEHVVRIQAIKRLQRDRSLPLSEIKALLSNFDYGALSFTDDLGNFELALHSRIDGDLPSHDQPLKAVAKATGLTEAELVKLDEVGAIQIKKANGKSLLDFRDVGIAECWAQLMRAGYADQEGFDEEFLRPYAEAMKPLADSVVNTFFKQFGGAPTEAAAELAAEGTAITNELLVRLHTQALMRATRERIERE